MSTLKSLTIVAGLLAGTSVAMAQNGLPTGGERPVAGALMAAVHTTATSTVMATGTGLTGTCMATTGLTDTTGIAITE
jgi:hypothetical protein